MKRLEPVLVLWAVVFILAGCINPDQGGQRGKNEGRDSSMAVPGNNNP